MITLQQILRTQSDILENAKVKLVRHNNSRVEHRGIVKEGVTFLDDQKEQSKNLFGECDYIVSFIGTERKRSIFFGAFKVNGVELHDETHKYHYDLEAVTAFDDLIGRIVIHWGEAAIKWDQWYDKNPKEVVEILPKGYIGNFPGLLNFVLEFDDLKQLVNNPEANYEWKNHLSSVNGIYMILDSKTGQQYIGSANGKHGIWGRWCEYASSDKSGGNTKLKALLQNDPHYYRCFRYSVLQTLPSNITKPEIVKIENLYKEKLGSKANGLNLN